MAKSVATVLREQIQELNKEEYEKFKDDRKEMYQNYSLRSSFFGVTYWVTIPFIIILLPFDFSKSPFFIGLCVLFLLFIIYAERKYGSIQGLKGRLGVVFTGYKLNRVRRFFGVRFY